MGPGHDQGPLLRLGQDAGDVEHVLGLEAEVELLDDGLGEELDQGGGVGQRRHRDASHQSGGDPAHGGQVAADQGGHLGALDLDDHGLARLQGGRVDLGDRGRRHRCALEAGEDLLQGSAQVLLHGGPHDLVALGRDLVAQEPELADQLLGEDPLAGGENLAELDVGGPEAFEGPPQPAGEPGPGCGRALAPVQEVPAPHGHGQPGAHQGHPASGREPAATDQAGDLGPGGGPDGAQAGPPAQLVGLHQPGRVLGEGAQGQIGRGLGRRGAHSGDGTGALCGVPIPGT